MATLVEYFFNSLSSVFKVETLEIYHPSFSTRYRIVRNYVGATFSAETEESGNPVRTFSYYPCNIEVSGSSDDLDYAVSVAFGDLGEIIPQELDRVFSDGNIAIRPVVTYRVYQCSSGSSFPLSVSNLIEYGSNLQIKKITFDNQGCTFEASAQDANVTSIGIKYNTKDFPGLLGIQ